MHRTCAALTVVTALLCSGESNGLTDAIEERRPRIDAKLEVLAVDPQRDRDRALDVRSVQKFSGRGALPRARLWIVSHKSSVLSDSLLQQHVAVHRVTGNGLRVAGVGGGVLGWFFFFLSAAQQTSVIIRCWI